MSNKFCNTSQMWMFGGYLKLRDFLYTQIIVWANGIQNHIDAWAII